MPDDLERRLTRVETLAQQVTEAAQQANAEREERQRIEAEIDRDIATWQALGDALSVLMDRHADFTAPELASMTDPPLAVADVESLLSGFVTMGAVRQTGEFRDGSPLHIDVPEWDPAAFIRQYERLAY